MDIIHCPVFYLKHDVSETEFCLRLHVEYTQLGPTDRASICLRRQFSSSTYWAKLSRLHQNTETDSSLRYVVF
jgi:hypothetical protein